MSLECGGTEQKLAVIPQETQSIPDELSVPTLCFFLSTRQGSLEFSQLHHLLFYLGKKINTLHACDHPDCCQHCRTLSFSLVLSAEAGDCLLCHLHLFYLCLSARCGGTVGAILTCPLEVVKTRLQSSSITLYVSEVQLSTVNGPSVARVSPPGPLHFLKWVLKNI